MRWRGEPATSAEGHRAPGAHRGEDAARTEAHLPDRGAAPVPAAGLAEALREATRRGARAARERRVPDRDAVRSALEEWPETAAPASGTAGSAAPDDDTFVRDAARLVLDALAELSEALDTAVPPMALDGTAPLDGTTGAAGTVPDEPGGVRNPGSP
ncbi:hypothetical protein [Streptomyces beigongshangae]|uniref:hypothetical protein n=1 Tax=Streptomyces beigongshangae TaxID=2841597 RepID=UPI001C864F39|nr:hypothetical protein [Streptomyces sp. REN17]